MKELIDRLNEVRGNIFNSDRYAGISDDQPEHDDMQTVLEAIAALEAVEANFEESRADNYRMALELADMKREAAELRARVAELEGMVPKWVPVAERLPTKSCTVLVAFPSAFGGAIPTTRVAIYCAGVFTYPSSDMAIRDATHWMQYTLPAAPKEEV